MLRWNLIAVFLLSSALLDCGRVSIPANQIPPVPQGSVAVVSKAIVGEPKIEALAFWHRQGPGREPARQRIHMLKGGNFRNKNLQIDFDIVNDSSDEVERIARVSACWIVARRDLSNSYQFEGNVAWTDEEVLKDFPIVTFGAGMRRHFSAGLPVGTRLQGFASDGLWPWRMKTIVRLVDKDGHWTVEQSVTLPIEP
jgi:hypothetical protein